MKVSPKITFSINSSFGLSGLTIKPPTIPSSTLSSSLLEKYSTAFISKIPGVLIQSVASTRQHIYSACDISFYK
jgi:hypothetical protein